MRHIRPSPLDDFISQAGAADEKRGFCSAEMTLQELESHQRQFRILRRFAITQSSGKQRVIDDGAIGGQSFHSSDQNKLFFCTALQPSVHVRALLQALDATGIAATSVHDT
jgi:hypothetical protein